MTYKVSWTHKSGRQDTVRGYLTLKGAYAAAVSCAYHDDIAKPRITVVKSKRPLLPINPWADILNYHYAP